MKVVVLDTNVLVSALIVPHGKPAQILRAIDSLELLTSEDILTEVRRVLRYPRIVRKYGLMEEAVSAYLGRVTAASRVIEVHTHVRAVPGDEDDDKFLACAIDGGAQYLMSGDPHLLALGTWEGIVILSPAAFLALLVVESAG